MLSESTQTKHLEFDVEEMERFEFTPGQFVSMVAPNADGKNITRAYSIASAPYGNKRFDICLNRVPEGFFSNHLCDMKVGETVKFHGPHGNFVLRNPLRDAILIATGTGIAPMRSFVQWLFADPARTAGVQIYLAYGTRYTPDLYYNDFFCEYAAKHQNLHYVCTLSRAGEEWSGKKGYVQERVREFLMQRPEGERMNADAYICGLNDMVSANRKMLMEEFGWDKKQVIFERYD
jgi:ferredoxin-NADP reductase